MPLRFAEFAHGSDAMKVMKPIVGFTLMVAWVPGLLSAIELQPGTVKAWDDAGATGWPAAILVDRRVPGPQTASCPNRSTNL